ncbi:MAG: TVP38/TMEM64 family protein [Hyphomicrobiaceae bacterium]
MALDGIGRMNEDVTEKKEGIGRFLPLLVIAGLMIFVFAMGWHRHLSLQNLAENREALAGFINDNFPLAVLAYMALYIGVVALSLPGGAVLTITGGLLFGWLVGGVATVVAATVGATLLFLIVKTSLGEVLARKAGPWLEKLKDGFSENALSYLLFLRLVPAFPFWLVNIAPGLLGVRLPTYVLGTFFGIIPGTFAFAFLGSGLNATLESARADHAACVAANGADACAFSLGLGDIVNTELLIAFAALGLVALIPIAFKRFRKSKTGSEAA